MSRRLRLPVSWALLVLLTAPVLRAQFNWTGWAFNGDFFSGGNWQGGVAPPNNGTAAVVFGNASQSYLYYNTSLQLNSVAFNGIVRPFFVQGPLGTLNLGSGGLTYAPTGSFRSIINDAVTLTASQTWNINSGTLRITGPIGDASLGHLLTKTGAGSLEISRTDAGAGWTGGLTLGAGRVVAYSSSDSYNFTHASAPPLGFGTLTFNGGTLVAKPYPDFSGGIYPLKVTNAVVSNGLIATQNATDLIFLGAVSLTANTTIQSQGRPLVFTGAFTESGGARQLTVDSGAPVRLEGSSGWTGGTDVINRSVLIFAGEDNTPGTLNAIKVGADAYVGTAVVNNVGLFLSELDKPNTLGAIGFDSDLLTGPDTLTTAIDLTGFNASARLGSATTAILGSTATITPQGSSYRFGGGGGLLQVDSRLTGARALVVDSPAARPLTLRLDDINNDFTGGTTVTNSGLLIYAGFYPGGVGSITINNGGYVGFRSGDGEDVTTGLPRVNPASTGMVGFDGNFSSLVINTAVDLSSFTNGIYLGTATTGGVDDGFYGGLTLTGALTPAGGASAPYRFAGYKGGLLQVATNLTGTNGVHIGDPNSPGTFLDPVRYEYSTVALSGDNAGLSGDIHLYAGQLGVSQINGVTGTDPTSALGTGNLIVQGASLPAEWNNIYGTAPRPKIVVENFDTIIANPVTLNTNLSVGGFPDFEFRGVVSGTGGLYVEDGLGFTLSGNNTFSGGVYLYQSGILFLDHDNAAGTGALSYGGTTDAQIYFNTAAPTVGGLARNDPDDFARLFAVQPNTVLTINQAADSAFGGEIRSTDASDSVRLVKSGPGTLQLMEGGLYYHNGTTEGTLSGAPEVNLQINQGTVVIGRDFFIEDPGPTVWVHGGTLALDNQDSFFFLQNPLVVDNGGRIAGNGLIASSLAIGTGATLSPGLDLAGYDPVGRLEIYHLSLRGGGSLDWDIMRADPTSGAWDQLFVSTPSTLDLTGVNLEDPASPATRFTLKVISRQLNGTAGPLADFDPSLNYSWLLFSNDNVAGFDPAKVIIDSSQFANSLAYGPQGNGEFFLTQNGNNIMLNFAAVPEPSTYGLMLVGLGLLVVTARRRRHPPTA